MEENSKSCILYQLLFQNTKIFVYQNGNDLLRLNNLNNKESKSHWSKHGFLSIYAN